MSVAFCGLKNVQICLHLIVYHIEYYQLTRDEIVL